MKTIEQIDKEIKKLEKKKQEILDKNLWLKFEHNGEKLEITTKQQHNGRTYSEILRLLKRGEKIASYQILQTLRNQEAHECFKEFWVFVPNPDKISEKNNYTAGFDADWGGADLDCNWDPSYSSSSLGVFIVRRSGE